MAGEEPESRWDMYEHLKVLWQTVALVNALMVSACITTLNSDVSKLDVGEQRIISLGNEQALSLLVLVC